MEKRTTIEETLVLETPVESPTSQEAPSSRKPSPSPQPQPRTIRSRLRTDQQVELIQICTRWIGQYISDKNGGKTFWEKVHETLESVGTRYSADSCKLFVQSRMQDYDQRAPIQEELEEPLRAWKLAVDGRKEEEKQQKIDGEKAKKEKADKKKADKEKADKEKAEKKKAEKEKVAKRAGSKKPVDPKKPDDEAGPSKKPREAPRTTIPDSQEDVDNLNPGDTSIPGIESDQFPELPKRELSDISPVEKLPVKKPRTRSVTSQSRPALDKGKTRATSLQAGPTQRKPSVPTRSGAKPVAKPIAAVPPPPTTGGKRKRPAPKASVDDAPGPSTHPTKKAKTTNDFLEELANGLEGHLTRIEENIEGKFGELKKEVEALKSEVTILAEWHLQLNDAINHERGIVIKESKTEVHNTSEVVVNTTAAVEVTEQSPGSEEPKSTDEISAERIEHSVSTTQGSRLATIDEVTETSNLGEGEKEARYRGPLPRPDTPYPETSGDEGPSSSSSDEDEDVPAPKIAK